MKRMRWAILGVAVSGVLTLSEPAWLVGTLEPPRQWAAAALSEFLYQGLYWLTPEQASESNPASSVGDLWDRYQAQNPDLVPVVQWPQQGRHMVVASGRDRGVVVGDWVTHTGILIGRVDATTEHLARVLSAGSQRFRVAAQVRELDSETGALSVVGRVLLRGAWGGVLRAEISNGLRAEWDGHAVFCADNSDGKEWLIGYVGREDALGEWIVRLSADDVRPDVVQIRSTSAMAHPTVLDSGDETLRRASGVVLSAGGPPQQQTSYLVRLTDGDVVRNGDAVLLNGGVVGRVVRAGVGTCRFRLFCSPSLDCSGMILRRLPDGDVRTQTVATVIQESGLPVVTRGFEDRIPRGLPLTIRPRQTGELQPGAQLTFVGSGLAVELSQLMRRSS